jgi:hypothetical protein
MFNPWLALPFQAARLAWQVQNAMALRVMGLAGARGQSKHLVPPGNGASPEKHTAETTNPSKGANGHEVAARKVAKNIISVHRKRARRDKRRLSKMARKTR